MEKMSNTSTVVTVTADYKKAVYTWNDTCDECTCTAYGFEDEELESLESKKAHMGADVEGYTVLIQ